MVGPAFSGYTQFTASTAVMPPRHPAFYPQPILYWGYPSPPVSPTYYGPPPPPHVAPNLGPQHQTTLVSKLINFVVIIIACFTVFWWNMEIGIKYRRFSNESRKLTRLDVR